MAIKVLITRQFWPGAETEAFKVASKIRSAAMSQPGYISGESLVSMEDPNKMVVVGSWHSLESWQEWYDSPTRAEIDQEMEPYLNRPVVYEAFHVGLRPAIIPD